MLFLPEMLCHFPILLMTIFFIAGSELFTGLYLGADKMTFIELGKPVSFEILIMTVYILQPASRVTLYMGPRDFSMYMLLRPYIAVVHFASYYFTTDYE